MNETLRRVWSVVPVAAAVVVTTLLLLLVGASPGVTFGAMYEGAFGTVDRAMGTLAFWVPLLLCTTGLLVTFTSGLWNIGVEGQMIMGSIAASWVALKVTAALPGLPGIVIIPLELVLAMGAGAFWAALAAVFKTRGGVHEIFGGVALNSLAVIATNYLISGPWQPPEGGTFRGTEPFPRYALLPRLILPDQSETLFSPLSLILAGVAFAIIALLLRDTLWGLKLKALGKNLRSAFLLGVSSERELITSMMVCGALAGLGGSVRVLSWFDSLRQSISGGIGFLAILIVLLAGLRPIWVLVIGLLFSALLNGGTIVQLRTQLHSSLSGIIQGLLVLFVLLFGDVKRVFPQSGRTPVEETAHE